MHPDLLFDIHIINLESKSSSNVLKFRSVVALSGMFTLYTILPNDSNILTLGLVPLTVQTNRYQRFSCPHRCMFGYDMQHVEHCTHDGKSRTQMEAGGARRVGNLRFLVC